MAMSLAGSCFAWPAVCSKRGVAVRSSHYLRPNIMAQPEASMNSTESPAISPGSARVRDGIEAVEAAFTALLTSPTVTKMLHELRADDARTLSEQRAIAQMPAPPFQERVRAEYCHNRFAELGLKETAIDAAGNVIGRRRGAGRGPKLVVSAHLDTVFPQGTD